MQLQSGYAYEYQGKRNWLASHDEKWDTVVYSPDGKEIRLGNRKIDGSWTKVFRCQDGKIRAQVLTYHD